MTALIIYDNLASATTARRTLQHAAHRAELRNNGTSNLARGCSEIPLAADEALKEATDADLIVFRRSQAYQRRPGSKSG